MKLRANKILQICIVTLLIFAAILCAYYLQNEIRDNKKQLADLEKNVELHAISQRGLTPCSIDEQRSLGDARAALFRAGDKSPDALVLATPALLDTIRIISFSGTTVSSYQVPKSDTFSSNFNSSNFKGNNPAFPQKQAVRSLAEADYSRILAALLRHTKHAMTSIQSGHDGMTYIFGIHGNFCAFTWTPGNTWPYVDDSVADHLIRIVDDIHQPGNEFRTALDALERIDSISLQPSK